MTLTLRAVRERTRKERRDPSVPIFLCRLVSIFFTWGFVRLGVTADAVTFLSFLGVVAGGAAMVLGYPLAGALLWLAFVILDCSDGEVARLTGPTKYGGQLDSIGADLFYAVAPFAVGIFLARVGTSLGALEPLGLAAVGAAVGLSFLLYRLLGVRTAYSKTRVRGGGAQAEAGGGAMTGPPGGPPWVVKRAVALYQHPYVRQNLFAEPALVLFFLAFTILARWDLLAVYLLVLLGYNLGYLAFVALKTYRAFRRLEAGW